VQMRWLRGRWLLRIRGTVPLVLSFTKSGRRMTSGLPQQLEKLGRPPPSQKCHIRTHSARIVDAVSRAWRDLEVGLALLDGSKGASVILVLNQLRSLTFGFKIQEERQMNELVVIAFPTEAKAEWGSETRRMWHDKIESIGDLWRCVRTRLCRKR
jgi:hypothetical protein